jgi:hypothetical protein
MSAVKTWLEILANPPRCCASCDHYATHSGGFEEGASCKQYGAKPPREYVEEPNDCPQWSDLVPF